MNQTRLKTAEETLNQRKVRSNLITSIKFIQHFPSLFKNRYDEWKSDLLQKERNLNS